jgi:F-type H+-transporting ATPase subunit b
MVSLNFTLVVELVLFVLFLFGTTRFILRPALKVIDEREAQMDADHAQAEECNTAAARLETEYQRAIAAARADADHVYRDAHMKLIDEHAARLNAARQAADEAVLATRARGEEELSTLQAELMEAAPGLAQDLAERLDLRKAGA